MYKFPVSQLQFYKQVIGTSQNVQERTSHARIIHAQHFGHMRPRICPALNQAGIGIRSSLWKNLAAAE